MRLHSLTGLRIFAALMVFGRHAADRGSLDGAEGVVNFLSPGMVGVSFFYIVSGFILTWTARTGDRPSLFYRRRFARVYPLYAVCWLLTLIILIASGTDIGWKDFFALTLLQAWFPDESIYFAVSAVFWSLSCEAFFYLVFPWILPAIKRLNRNSQLALMLGIIVAVFVIAAAIDPLVQGSVGHWFLYFFPPVRLLEFVLGILIALQLQRDQQFAFPLWAATALAVMVFIASAYAPGAYMRVATMIVPFALLTWSAAQADLLERRSLFRWRPIVTLGVWSFAFYLVHAQVLLLTFAALSFMGINTETLSGVPLGGTLLFAVLLSIGAAGVLHIVVEAPLERLLRPQRRPVSNRASL